MPLETRMWEIDGTELKKTDLISLAKEEMLHEWVQTDIGIIDPDLLVIGKEVMTDLGERLDLLAIDPAGQLVVIELKRGRTPRDVVAQVLGYTAWAAELSYERISDIARSYLDTDLADAFEKAFDKELPELINQTQRMIVAATELDPYVERSLRYLSEEWAVNINAVFFCCLQSTDGRQWLVRSWLEEPSEVERRRETSRGWTASTMDELRARAKEKGAETEFDLLLKLAEKWELTPYRAANKVSLHGKFEDGKRRKILGIYPGMSPEAGRIAVETPVDRMAKYFGIPEDQVEALLPEPLHDYHWARPMSSDDIERLAKAIGDA